MEGGLAQIGFAKVGSLPFDFRQAGRARLASRKFASGMRDPVEKSVPEIGTCETAAPRVNALEVAPRQIAPRKANAGKP